MTATKVYSSKKLVTAATCLALGVLLPIIFHSVPGFGPTFLPMHLPVLLCGMLTNWQLGLLCGVATPLLSSLMTGMPPFPVIGLPMCFELATYGIVIALLVKRNAQLALVSAMVAGRVVSALAQLLIWGLGGKAFALPAFLTASFVTALPGIAIQLALLPLLYAALAKSGLLEDKNHGA